MPEDPKSDPPVPSTPAETPAPASLDEGDPTSTDDGSGTSETD